LTFNDIHGYIGNKRRNKLEASSANTPAVVGRQVVPNQLFAFLTLILLCVFYRVELKNVDHFAVVHFLVSGTPRFYKLETVGQGMEHARSYSIKICFRHLFILPQFFRLLKLFVRKVKEHFEG